MAKPACAALHAEPPHWVRPSASHVHGVDVDVVRLAMTERDDDDWTIGTGLDWLWVAIGAAWFAGLGILVLWALRP